MQDGNTMELVKADTSKAKTLRALIAQKEPIVTPSAYDVLSARIIGMLGFKSISLGGSTMLAARYGLPDLGLAGFSEMLEATRDIVSAVDVPCIADADDGYGDLKSVVRTIRAYEDIGVAALVLEDQERVNKRPGDSDAQRVSDVPSMVSKLRTAIAYRQNRNTLVVARSDCYALEGLDGALRRCEAYLGAGADGIFVSGVSKHEHLRAIGGAFPGVYKVIVQVEGSNTPMLSARELFNMGFTQIAYPTYILNRVLLAMESACLDLNRATAAAEAPRILPELEQVRGRFNAAIQMAAWRKIEEGAA